MFDGVPARIITASLVLLAALLVALYGPTFRKRNSLLAISTFCTCNPSPVLLLRQLCASFCKHAANWAAEQQGDLPPLWPHALLKLQVKEMFKTRGKATQGFLDSMF